MSVDLTTAHGRIRALLPHLQVMVNDAVAEYPASTVMLSVNVKHPEGGGRIMGGFAFDSFMKDLIELVGSPEITEDELLDASAQQFMLRHGIALGAKP